MRKHLVRSTWAFLAAAVATITLLVLAKPGWAPDVVGRASTQLALRSSVVLESPPCGGVIARYDLVLTAFHCVSEYVDNPNRGPVRVREHGGGWMDARVVWTRPGADLALLRTSRTMQGRVPSLAADVEPGDALILVGSPAGHQFVVTRGWVAKVETHRWVRCDGSPMPFGGDAVQWVFGDVAVFYGNSGGGGFDEYGNLLGILTRAEIARSTPACEDRYQRTSHILWAYLVGVDEIRRVTEVR